MIVTAKTKQPIKERSIKDEIESVSREIFLDFVEASELDDFLEKVATQIFPSENFCTTNSELRHSHVYLYSRLRQIASLMRQMESITSQTERRAG